MIGFPISVLWMSCSQSHQRTPSGQVFRFVSASLAFSIHMMMHVCVWMRIAVWVWIRLRTELILAKACAHWRRMNRLDLIINGCPYARCHHFHFDAAYECAMATTAPSTGHCHTVAQIVMQNEAARAYGVLVLWLCLLIRIQRTTPHLTLSLCIAIFVWLTLSSVCSFSRFLLMKPGWKINWM